MSQFAPNISKTFYQFSGSLPCTIQCVKNLEVHFSVLARYDPFCPQTKSKMKNLDFYHKTYIIYFHQKIDCSFMNKLKTLQYWPCPKSKWVLSCWNRKMDLYIFNMLYSALQMTRILTKSSRNVGSRWTHFCQGAKILNGYGDPCFTLRSKILVFGGTLSFSQEFLILVPNRNYVQKVLDWFGQSYKPHLWRRASNDLQIFSKNVVILY